MPNWCINQLEVTGPDADLDRFLEATTSDADDNGDRHLSFDRLVPMPAEYEQGELWYNWRIEHWGTKWDLGTDTDSVPVVDDDLIFWEFSTAWAPPEPWLLAASEKFPTLTFTLGYDEPGMCFAGVLTVKNGIVDEDRSWQGDSMSWISCAVPNCPSDDDGPVASYAPLDFRDGAPGPETRVAYCDSHRLVEAVVQANREEPDTR